MAEKFKSLLVKIRFLEYLSTRHADLSSLQLAVATRLVSAWNPRRGYAWVSLDRMAADLGAERRSVVRAVRRLVEVGLFDKQSGGGRGRASHYWPRFDRVPEGDVYHHSETGTTATPYRGNGAATKTGTTKVENGDRTPPPTVTSNRSASAASRRRDASQTSHMCRELAKFETTLKKIEGMELSARDREALAKWADALCKFSAEIGDVGLAGWSRRLSEKALDLLEADEGVVDDG